MINQSEQRKIITEIVGKAIESGQIKFEQPQIPQAIV